MSIRHLLDEGRIVSFELTPDRMSVVVTEECDRYYSVVLNKDHVLQLIAELTELTNSLEGDVRPRGLRTLADDEHA